MSGKARPSLRRKTLENVKFCNLSQTDKDCIKAVFDIAKRLQEENQQLKQMVEYQKGVSAKRFFEIMRLKAKSQKDGADNDS